MSVNDMYVWALCVWREARGDGHAAMLAVAWVMMNRLRDSKHRWGSTMHDVVEDRLQFSSMTALGDPETVLWPSRERAPADLEAFADAEIICMGLAGSSPGADPTGGAKWYFSKNIEKPHWANAMILSTTVGSQEFYTEAA